MNISPPGKGVRSRPGVHWSVTVCSQFQHVFRANKPANLASRWIQTLWNTFKKSKHVKSKGLHVFFLQLAWLRQIWDMWKRPMHNRLVSLQSIELCNNQWEQSIHKQLDMNFLIRDIGKFAQFDWPSEFLDKWYLEIPLKPIWDIWYSRIVPNILSYYPST